MQKATKTRPWTRADLERLPDDGNRYEVLDGDLFVTPQASVVHQLIATELAVQLAHYCRAHSLGFVVGPGAMQFGENELQPDVQVIPGPMPALGVKWADLPLPLLVVEILSESTARRDLGAKRDAYLRLGVPTYWVVDCDRREVRVSRHGVPEPQRLAGTVQWRPLDDLDPLEIRLDQLFPRVNPTT